MILIADSGSTKTTWSLINPVNGEAKTCRTSGINPMYQDEESISHVLQEEFLLEIPDSLHLFFYGAGCISKAINQPVHQALTKFFCCSVLSVETDLMGAARALCKNNEGIACILGTGSNSCYYNGRDIVRNISPLGYMLGDEGSGAVIGRKFIGHLLKNQLPEEISTKFSLKYNMTAGQILEHVYKKPFPNRFLAQFAEFINENLQEPTLQKIVKHSFGEFFSRNIKQYPEAKNLPVHFIGGIAFYFEKLLREAATESGFQIGKIMHSPMQGLIEYHLEN
jgi:N-acetylglucosamine kinase-like BadF-type ATPase